MLNSRQFAFLVLRAIDRGAFADVALDQVLRQSQLNELDRSLITELVYGSVRRQRTLDALITQLSKKRADQQPRDLRLILHLGLYQLRYLNHIPAAAAVNTSVDLAKHNNLKGLSGLVNGILRQYARLASQTDPLQLPTHPVERLGVLHSYPDWIVAVWLEQLSVMETEHLCEWLNQPPAIDLRVNVLQTSVDQVRSAFQEVGVDTATVSSLPQALRLKKHVGAIRNLPGFEQGWWMVQDSSAQLVAHLLDPSPGQTVLDACAAPGGKTMHLAELIQDQGQVWACDRSAARLRKILQNSARLQLQSIQICEGDSRNLPQFVNQGDRVLLDAPCSGLGTLHRHADARWKQTPDSVKELAQLQAELIDHVATWVKPDGALVYATCTLHPWENERVVESFLARHPEWQIDAPQASSPIAAFVTAQGWVKVWPHRHHMDGFFMVRLKRRTA